MTTTLRQDAQRNREHILASDALSEVGEADVRSALRTVA